MMDYAGRVAEADTYPKLLRLNAREHGGEIALREKDFGLWRLFTWNHYQNRVHDFALGLVELGLTRGDVIGIIGDNRPDWVAAEIASHAIGAMSLGLYRDVLDEEAAYLLTYGEAKLVFAEDEEQVDKLLNLAERAPQLKHIVYSNPRGMRKYDDPRLIEADTLAAMGRDRAAREPALYDRMVDATKGEDCAILCTTSGTTAHPKLAMLAAGRVLRHCAAYLAFDPKGPDDEYVSVLPLPWIMEQVYALGKGLLCRMKVNFVERPDTMMSDFREIAPTFVLFAPRVWEAIAADVRARVMDASPLKQGLFELGMKTGLAALANGGDRWGSARPRHVQVLPGDGRAAPHALRPDRAAGGLYAASRRSNRPRHHRRADGQRHRNPHREPGQRGRRRDRGAPSQHVPGLLQEPGDLCRRYEGRLDAFGRRRLYQR
jgi:long-chain acyl-CoA synthetase